LSTNLSLVAPVADYEPPPCGGPPVLPPPVPAGRATARRAPARRRVADPPAPVAPAAPAAAAFADAVLRRVLEVIDGRRPPAQVRPLLAAGLAESLPARRAVHPGVLRRVRVVPVRPDGGAAEVAAIYRRGERVGAIAGRVELVATPAGPRWQLVALHIG